MFSLDINKMIKHNRYIFILTEEARNNANIIIYSITDLYGKALKYNFFQHLVRYISIIQPQLDLQPITINKISLKKLTNKAIFTFDKRFIYSFLEDYKNITDITFKAFYDDVFAKAFNSLDTQSPIPINSSLAKKMFREILLSMKDTISNYYY
jgi:hypothetical protein